MLLLNNSTLFGLSNITYESYNVDDYKGKITNNNDKKKSMQSTLFDHLIVKCDSVIENGNLLKCFDSTIKEKEKEIINESKEVLDKKDIKLILEDLSKDETINNLFIYSIYSLIKELKNIPEENITIDEIFKLIDHIQSSLKILKEICKKIKDNQQLIDLYFKDGEKSLIPLMRHVICNNPDLDYDLLKKIKLPNIDDIIKIKDLCEKKGCKFSKNIDEFVKCEPYQPNSNYASIELPGELDLGSDASKYECCDIGIIGNIKYNIGMSL